MLSKVQEITDEYNTALEVHGGLVWLDPENLPVNIIPPVRAIFQYIAERMQFAEWDWKQ